MAIVLPDPLPYSGPAHGLADAPPIALASGVFHLNIRLPANIAEKARGSAFMLPVDGREVSVRATDKVMVSLRTKDPAIAKRRFFEAHQALLTQWQAVREGPKPLLHRDIVGIAGEATGATTSGRWNTLLVCLPRATVGRMCQAADLDVDPAQLAFTDLVPGHEAPALDSAPRVASEIGGTDAFARLRVDLITQELVIDMLRGHSSVAHLARRGPGQPARGGLGARLLRRVLGAMDDMRESEVTLARLAATAGCSTTHFRRAFKQSTGTAPFAWLLDRRIERAKGMLEEGSLSVAEIALAVGFSAQPQFATAFRRLTGLSPRDWRLRTP